MTRPLYLIGDIGGTNIRLGILQLSDGQILCIKTYRCADYVRFNDALKFYIESLPESIEISVSAMCLAVPGTVHEDVIKLINNHWIIDRHELTALYQCPIYLINDFTAQALAIQSLKSQEIDWLRPSDKYLGSLFTKAIVGPGTGFGVAALLPSGDVIDSEAGHVSFAPVTTEQIEILNTLSTLYQRVSVERLLSGPGIANIYWALCQNSDDLSLKAIDKEKNTAEKISESAYNGDAMCLKTINEFSRILGSVCGDLALAFGALGGLYLSGGIINKLGSLFNKDEFLNAFNRKGRYTQYCSEIPIAIIDSPQPGLIGSANYLLQALNSVTNSTTHKTHPQKSTENVKAHRYFSYIPEGEKK